MAEKVVDIESTLANFGLTGGGELAEDPIEESSLDKESQQESEELEEVDASDDEEIEEDDDEDADADDFDDEEETEDSVDSSDWKKKALAAERQMRKFQSEKDSLVAQNNKLDSQFQQLVNEFKSLKQSIESNEEEDEFDLDLANDDEVLTGSEVKQKLLNKKEQVQQKKYIKQLEDAVQANLQVQQAEQSALNSHPEMSKIVEYSKNLNIGSDPELSAVQGNTAGLFYAVRSKMLEDQVKDLRKQLKKSRGKVPPTSSKTVSKRKVKEQVSEFERKFNNTFAKYGL